MPMLPRFLSGTQNIFIAANLQNHLPAWESILASHPKADELFGYLSVEVDVRDFFVHFKGLFQGNSSIPLFLHRTFSPTLEIVLMISSPAASLMALRMIPFYFMAR